MKIAILGPECSGKSTLSHWLATKFNGIVVNEYARDYFVKSQLSYDENDVITIAREQWQAAESAKKNGYHLVFSDTEMIVVKVWCDLKFGHYPEELKVLLTSQQFDHYLLCAPDLAWEFDPLREHPAEKDREDIFNRQKKELDAMRVAYTIISGKGESRLMQAAAIVEQLIIS